MAAVLRSPSHFPSSPSSSLSNDGPPSHYSTTLLSDDLSTAVERGSEEEETERRKERRRQEDEEEEQQQQENQLSILALLVALFRKSLVSCRTEREGDFMEIGWPTNVRHVAHVTFDRFHGFLGLPVEFEPEVPRKAPSASASVFGVSTESMQCSFDCRGNSVPTILLLMQRRLYAQGGLQAEGIFRINAENDQEENVRDQLNRGIIPDGIDVHCLAGLIKAWFRELPAGVLDSLTSEQVMHCQTEDDSVALVKLLPPTEAALLDWAINLMADVVQEENNNKMNAHNIAMVFAPNMTQMDDPLTALIYAVQVMKFLKTLIERTLKERKEVVLECASTSYSDPSDENGHRDPSCLDLETNKEGKPEKVDMGDEYACSNPCELPPDSSTVHYEVASSELVPESLREESRSSNDNERSREIPTQTVSLASSPETTTTGLKPSVYVNTRSSRLKHKKGMKKAKGQQAILARAPTEKSRGMSLVSRINSRVERVEAWR